MPTSPTGTQRTGYFMSIVRVRLLAGCLFIKAGCQPSSLPGREAIWVPERIPCDGHAFSGPSTRCHQSSRRLLQFLLGFLLSSPPYPHIPTHPSLFPCEKFHMYPTLKNACNLLEVTKFVSPVSDSKDVATCATCGSEQRSLVCSVYPLLKRISHCQLLLDEYFAKEDHDLARRK